MKIKSIYISSFGGIKDLNIDLEKGLNIIYGRNEQGKTTLMSFIKMMFYGSGRASSQIYKNLRKKYTPWDNSLPAGSITFEHGGRNYKLEREFLGSDSKDRVTLYDLDLGTRESVGAEPGAEFFQLSAAAFERSIFIGQLGFQDSNTEAEGELNSKLSNLALTGDSSVSFESVNSRLEKAKTLLMSKSGKTGEYDKNIRLLAELNDRISVSQKINEEYAIQMENISKAEEHLKKLCKKYLEIKEKISLEQDIRNGEKYKNLLLKKSELEEINKKFLLSDGSLIDENYLRKLQLCTSKYENSKNRLENKNNEIKLLENNLNPNLKTSNQEQLDSLNKEIADLEQSLNSAKANISLLQNQKELRTLPSKLRVFGLVSLTIGFMLISASIFLFSVLTQELSATLVVIIGALLVISGIILNIKDKNKRLNNLNLIEQKLIKENNTISEINNEILLKKVKIEALNTALSANATTKQQQEDTLNNLYAQREILTKELEENHSVLLELFSKYKPIETDENISDFIEEISKITNIQKQKKQELNYILNDLNGISYEDAEKKLNEIKEKQIDTSIDFEGLKKEYETLSEAITEGKSKISAQIAKAKAELDNAENLKGLKEKLSNTSKVLEEQKMFCDAIDIATQTLTESFAEIRKGFGSQLEQHASKIFKNITGEKYENMYITKSFEISVSQKNSFGSKEIDYLSSGAVDQAYLSLKLALTELMCKDKEILPLFLDDILAQYDDDRAKTTIEFLNNYSVPNQSVMFTCHNHIKKMAESANANIIDL